MKANYMMNATNGSRQNGMKVTPNAEMVSRQIENLRVVVRRMKASESSTLDSLINQKLKDRR